MKSLRISTDVNEGLIHLKMSDNIFISTICQQYFKMPIQAKTKKCLKWQGSDVHRGYRIIISKLNIRRMNYRNQMINCYLALN